MVENILIGRLISDLLEVSNKSTTDESLRKGFESVISGLLGIDTAEIVQMYNRQPPDSQVFVYVSNTRKPYIDNEISSFSEFPEIIEMGSKGYKSGIIFPVMVNGNIVASMNLFSKSPNRFTKELVDTLTYASIFIGLSITNRTDFELKKQLALYFDSSFNSSVPQMLVSSNGRIIKSNAALNRLLNTYLKEGTTTDEAIGMSFLDLEKGIGRTNIIDISTNDGMAIFEISSSRISNTLIHTVIREVKEERVMANIAKMLSKTKSMYLLNLDSNLNIVEIYGDTNGSVMTNMMLKRSISEFVAPADRAEVSKRFNIKVGETVYGELDMVDSSSGITPIKFNAVRTEYGYTLLADSATTELKLRELRDGMNDFISNTTDIFIIIDSSGYIKDCNIQVERLLGYKKGELIGSDVKNLYIDTGILDRDISYARKGTKINSTYVNLRKRDGGVLPGTHSLRMVRDEESPNFMIMVNELETKRVVDDQESELKSLRSELNKARSEAAMKSDFIFNISHELKTPLTSIMGYSRFLIDGEFGGLNDEQRDNIEIIFNESKRLTGIITQILDAIKLDAERVTLDIHEVNLRDLGNNPSIIALKESAASKSLSFGWNVDYNVPPIMADPNKLIQVFVNLIGNSIKFTDSGGINVRISMQSSRTVRCEVEDTGVGINDEDKRRIFKRFYQSQSKELTTKVGAGTGLGLSITQSIIKLHKGKIRIESEPGKGTKFIFTLPINYKPRRSRKG